MEGVARPIDQQNAADSIVGKGDCDTLHVPLIIGFSKTVVRSEGDNDMRYLCLSQRRREGSSDRIRRIIALAGGILTLERDGLQSGAIGRHQSSGS
jgi:hypothetical protein